jgi:hypothetical protein
VATTYNKGDTYSSGNVHPNGNGIKKKSAAVMAAPAIVRSVIIAIKDSDNAIEDAHLLREVIQVLLEYPGKDRVNLQIHTSTRKVLMELPVVSTGYCSELNDRLERMLGVDSVALQQSETVDRLEQTPF